MKNTVSVFFFFFLREQYFLKFFTRLRSKRKVREEEKREKKASCKKITARSPSYRTIPFLSRSPVSKTFTLDLKDLSRNKNTCRAETRGGKEAVTSIPSKGKCRETTRQNRYCTLVTRWIPEGYCYEMM